MLTQNVSEFFLIIHFNCQNVEINYMPFDQTTSLLFPPCARGTKFAYQETFFNTFSSQQKCIAMGNMITVL